MEAPKGSFFKRKLLDWFRPHELDEIERRQAMIVELAERIQQLAVNGSVEAARSSEAFRSLYFALNEINLHATNVRELARPDAIKKRDAG